LPVRTEIPPALAGLLAALAGELGACRRPWWLIGSAAVAVHGAAVEVRDVDLLLDPADAEAFLSRRGIAAAPGIPSSLFASALFAAWQEPPYQVEVFAGFRLREGGAWVPLVPETREQHEVRGACVYLPSVAELIAWGRRFGRAKDAAREPLLQALLAPHA
jgi:hypothetical protein